MKDFVAEYGHVIVDECHHLSAFTFERVMRQVKARVCCWPDGHANQERRASSNHLYAVRASAVQPRRSRHDGFNTFRAHRDAASH